MTADVVIVGAGVFGLWCARACLGRGMRVTVVEQSPPGGGASATPVGLLAPHNPVRWSPLKALQLDGLATLPAALADLKDETGCDPGYVRSGRVVALPDAEARQRALAQCEAAAVWGDAGTMRVRTAMPDPLAELLAPDASRCGVLWDDLTARVNARRCLEALWASVLPRLMDLVTGPCTGLRENGVEVHGTLYAGDRIVLTSGAETLPLAGLSAPRAFGEKGQAALLAADLPEACPAITGAGLYIVSHGPQCVAVGSTSERTWEHPEPDARLDAVLDRARALCPPLADAPVIDRWAGIRPRAPRPGPMVGGLPDRPNLWIATGGHKIGYALAHLVGDVVAVGLSGDPPPPAAAQIIGISDHLSALTKGGLKPA